MRVSLHRLKNVTVVVVIVRVFGAAGQKIRLLLFSFAMKRQKRR
jgi:hypothetical protein